MAFGPSSLILANNFLPLNEALCVLLRFRVIFSGFINFLKETKGMPKLFRFQHMLNSMTYSLLLIFAFWPWPSAEYSLNGRELDYQEFWLTGLAPAFLGFSFLMVLVCSACVNRHWTGRLGVFLYWSLIIAFLFFYSITGITIGLLLIAAWAYYVFCNNSVKLYFTEKHA